MKKRVLLICEALSGGVRKHIVTVLQHLSREKFDIAIAYGEGRADSVFWEFIKENKEKFTFYAISSFVREVSIIEDIKAILQLKKIIKEFQPEIIHCHSSKAGGTGRIAALLSGQSKVFYTPHGYIMQYPYISRNKRRLYGLIERNLGRITDCTINVSKGEYEAGRRYNLFRYQKSTIIYNGAEDKGFVKQVKNNGRIIVGTLARFDQSKDPLSFLEIAKAVVRLNPNVEFWYAGSGDYCKEEFLKVTEENPKIKYRGFISSIDDYLKDVDIYLSTSLHEALPYSVIEAMAVGKPVVATDVEGNNELVVHGYNGYLFCPGNIEEAVFYIMKLMEDEQGMGKCQLNSYMLFKERFHIQTMIQRLEEAYGQ
ncbi:glycosyltransferase family 1 protein [Neobacillus piezotolerans]|uniref:Glycosyltransferase family 1 protein n=1 Tax=Neobacillus piezotolerans TaxID=2259171 RepID=A0A3D8GNI2_9BACI|nr:glycosyltransferase family 4 protein [Neobacillus piezotolerans]RDU36040.1 glycosyltransferase family 1 protein [Neobacillus piezotolerans]